MIEINTVAIETTGFVRSKRKSNPREAYWAIARHDNGLLGTCFSSVPLSEGMHIAKSLEFRSDFLKSGRNVETFVAWLD